MNETGDDSRKNDEADLKAKVMSQEERDSFAGITIDQGEKKEESAKHDFGAGQERIYIRSWNVASTKLSWKTKILVGLAVLGLIATVAVIGVIGSIAVLLMAVGWMLSRFFRR